MMTFRHCWLAGVALALSALPAAAQTFPSGRVSVVVPFAAGGPLDAVIRLVAPKLQEKWQQPVIVENRPGAGGAIGTEYVVKSKPDGHTLMITGDAVTVMKMFMKDLAYDPMSSLKPVTMLVNAPYVVAVSSSVPARTLAEFVAYVKQRPKEVNYATIPFTQYQLQYPMFEEKTGASMTAVPYNGGAAMTTALLGGQVQMYFAANQQVAPHIAAGKVVALAVTSAERDPALPGVPTLRELGIDYVFDQPFSLFAPRDTPDAVAAKIAADAGEAIFSPDVEPRVRQTGYYPVRSTPSREAARLGSLAREYQSIAQRLGTKAN